MNSKRILSAAGAGVLAISLGLSSAAATVGLTFEGIKSPTNDTMGLTNSVSVHKPGTTSSYGYYEGFLRWQIASLDPASGASQPLNGLQVGDQLYTLCVEVTESISSNSANNVFTETFDFTNPQVPEQDASSLLDPDRTAKLGLLFEEVGLLVPFVDQLDPNGTQFNWIGDTTVQAGSNPTSSEKHAARINAAALQLAVWEIIYDSDMSLSTSGTNNFYIRYTSNSDGTAAKNLAAGWLSDVQTAFASGATPSTKVLALQAKNSQDQTLFLGFVPPAPPAVPLPASVWSGMALLGGLFAWAGYRRRWDA